MVFLSKKMRKKPLWNSRPLLHGKFHLKFPFCIFGIHPWLYQPFSDFLQKNLEGSEVLQSRRCWKVYRELWFDDLYVFTPFVFRFINMMPENNRDTIQSFVSCNAINELSSYMTYLNTWDKKEHVFNEIRGWSDNARQNKHFWLC